MSSASATSSRVSASASSGLTLGAKRRLTVTAHESGTTLLAIPPSTRTTCNDWRYANPSTSTVPGSVLAIRPSAAAARWIAFSPIHGRAVCARAPR